MKALCRLYLGTYNTLMALSEIEVNSMIQVPPRVQMEVKASAKAGAFFVPVPAPSSLVRKAGNEGSWHGSAGFSFLNMFGRDSPTA